MNNDLEEVTRRQRKQGYENSGKFRGQEEWAQEIKLLTKDEMGFRSHVREYELCFMDSGDKRYSEAFFP